MESNTNTTSSKLKILHVFEFLAIVVVSIVAGSFVYYFTARLLIINSMNVLGIFVVLLILAMALKINYTSKLFLANLLLSVVLVSFYPFGQGLIIIVLALMMEKLLKLT